MIANLIQIFSVLIVLQLFPMFQQIVYLFSFFIILTLISSQDPFPTFSEYVKLYKKDYKEDEYIRRFQIYSQNVKALKAITQYTPAVNRFTDQTEQQRKARKNVKFVDQNNRIARVPPNLSRVGAPTNFDWRNNGIITSVKDQGSCGACWAFVTAAHAESLLLMQKRFNNSIDLSEKFLIGCTFQSDCGGGYLEYALISGRKQPLQIIYPYASQKSVNCSTRRIDIAQTSNDYYNLTDSELIALLLQAPVPISISSESWQTYGSGVFKCQPNARVDHAVLLVGYTADYWIIKNQWGSRFGINGYIHISRNRSVNCKIGWSAHMMKGNGNNSDDQYFKNLLQNSQQYLDASTFRTSVITHNSTNSTANKYQQILGFKIILGIILMFLIQQNI